MSQIKILNLFKFPHILAV